MTMQQWQQNEKILTPQKTSVDDTIVSKVAQNGHWLAPKVPKLGS